MWREGNEEVTGERRKRERERKRGAERWER